jgi:hypothetical protein
MEAKYGSAMRCLVCGKRIGPLRRLRDRRYCCEAHRKTGRKSARVVRDLEDEGEFEEPWLVTAPPEEGQPPGRRLMAAVGIALLLCLVVLLLVAPSPRLEAPWSLAERIEQVFPPAPSLRLTEDFRAGFQAWTELSAGSPAWVVREGKLRPRQLRLWKPTVPLKDYVLDFEAEIEQKAVGWAFRASDTANYYAVKLMAAEPRAARRAAIVRYTVAGGKKLEPFTLPLPLALHTGTVYRIGLRVKADQFVTLIDGQVVDAWRDRRHVRGGIGFFCDPGEDAAVSRVQLTAFTGLMDRLRFFSLILRPGH